MAKAKIKIKTGKKPLRYEDVFPPDPIPNTAPAAKTKRPSVFYQWLFFILLGGGIYFLWHYWPDLPTMKGCQVLAFAISIAFVWVDILKWGVTKPFNCVKCMTGWLSLLIAVLFHVEFWYLYLFAGLFVGAMFEGIRMRWL